MTTISAGAAAGLLVALMALSTGDSRAAGTQPAVPLSNGFVHPGEMKGFNPQPDPPRLLGDGSVRMGDGSVRPASR